MPCRPRADRGIPGASLDWQRTRLLRTSVFSRRSPSNDPLNYSREVVVERAVAHVRILAIEAVFPDEKDTRTEEKNVSLAYLIITNRRRQAAILRQSPFAGVASFTIVRMQFKHLLIFPISRQLFVLRKIFTADFNEFENDSYSRKA